MAFGKIKSKQQERGFTIVELLIVIVVIAILAAITIVAYAGVTARARQSTVVADAASVQSVAEAMNADNGYYPALAQPTTAGTCPTPATGSNTSLACGSTSTKLPSGVTVVPDASTSPITSTSTPSSGNPTIAYACLTSCTSSTGGRITYWDPVTSGGQKAYVYVGSATSSGTWAYPAT